MKVRTKLSLAVLAAVAVVIVAVVPSLAAGRAQPPSKGDSPAGSGGGVSAPPCPAGAELFPCFPGPTPVPGTPNTVTVTGSASVTSEPDQAVIDLGVQTQATDAADALRENADRMRAVLAALRDLGIASDDIATFAVNVYPNYDPDGSGTNGYVADNQVAVTLHDLSLVGRAIDAAVGAGANLTSGVSFTLSDQSRGTSDALDRAVADARSKAAVLARAAGATLGDVVSINETTDGFEPPIYARGAAGAEGSTPVTPPDIHTSVSVTVVWALVTPR